MKFKRGKRGGRTGAGAGAANSSGFRTNVQSRKDLRKKKRLQKKQNKAQYAVRRQVQLSQSNAGNGVKKMEKPNTSKIKKLQEFVESEKLKIKNKTSNDNPSLKKKSVTFHESVKSDEEEEQQQTSGFQMSSSNSDRLSRLQEFVNREAGITQGKNTKMNEKKDAGKQNTKDNKGSLIKDKQKLKILRTEQEQDTKEINMMAKLLGYRKPHQKKKIAPIFSDDFGSLLEDIDTGTMANADKYKSERVEQDSEDDLENDMALALGQEPKKKKKKKEKDKAGQNGINSNTSSSNDNEDADDNFMGDEFDNFEDGFENDDDYDEVDEDMHDEQYEDEDNEEENDGDEDNENMYEGQYEDDDGNEGMSEDEEDGGSENSDDDDKSSFFTRNGKPAKINGQEKEEGEEENDGGEKEENSGVEEGSENSDDDDKRSFFTRNGKPAKINGQEKKEGKTDEEGEEEEEEEGHDEEEEDHDEEEEDHDEGEELEDNDGEEEEENGGRGFIDSEAEEDSMEEEESEDDGRELVHDIRKEEEYAFEGGCGYYSKPEILKNGQENDIDRYSSNSEDDEDLDGFVVDDGEVEFDEDIVDELPNELSDSPSPVKKKKKRRRLVVGSDNSDDDGNTGSEGKRRLVVDSDDSDDGDNSSSEGMKGRLVIDSENSDDDSSGDDDDDDIDLIPKGKAKKRKKHLTKKKVLANSSEESDAASPKKINKTDDKVSKKRKISEPQTTQNITNKKQKYVNIPDVSADSDMDEVESEDAEFSDIEEISKDPQDAISSDLDEETDAEEESDPEPAEFSDDDDASDSNGAVFSDSEDKVASKSKKKEKEYKFKEYISGQLGDEKNTRSNDDEDDESDSNGAVFSDAAEDDIKSDAKEKEKECKFKEYIRGQLTKTDPDEKNKRSSDDEDDASDSNGAVFSDEEEKVEPEAGDELKEDIYGRLRDKAGNVVNYDNNGSAGAGGKYVPPALRKLLAMNTDEKKKAQLTILKKSLKGQLNRLAESNIAGIASHFEGMYLKHSRNDMNDILTSLLMESLVAPSLTPERLVQEHAMLVAVLSANVGSEVGAHILNEFVLRWSDDMDKLSKETETKELDNLLLFIGNLYNFRVVDAPLLYDILNKLAVGFSAKEVEMILLVLRSVGFTLRKDNPLALKSLITKIQTQASAAQATQEEQEQEEGSEYSRVRFMLEVVQAIRNNNMAKVPNYDPAHSEHLKKIQKGLVRKGTQTSQLNVSLEDLLKSRECGRWWIVGSAWSGLLPGEKSPQEHRNPNASKQKDMEAEFSEKFKERAAKLQLSRPPRINILYIITEGSEDYLDAFEKLLQLSLPATQERELFSVVLLCSQKGKVYNPFFAHLSDRMCKFDKKYKRLLQFALWDKFQEVESVKPREVANLAKFLTHLVGENSLNLTIFKHISFMEAENQMISFLRQVLIGLLLHPAGSDTVQRVFSDLSASPKLQVLRQSLRIFILKFLSSKKSKENNEHQMLAKRIKEVTEILNKGRGISL